MRYLPLLCLTILSLTGCSLLTELPNNYENTGIDPDGREYNNPYYQQGLNEHEYSSHDPFVYRSPKQ